MLMSLNYLFIKRLIDANSLYNKDHIVPYYITLSLLLRKIYGECISENNF